MKSMDQFGTIRNGAVAKIWPWSDGYWKRHWPDLYQNRKWTLNFLWARATFTRMVELDNEDLSAFYAKGRCKSGSLVLKISQNNVEKEFDLSNNADEKVDMSNFNAGLIKLVITAKPAKSMKVIIGW